MAFDSVQPFRVSGKPHRLMTHRFLLMGTAPLNTSFVTLTLVLVEESTVTKTTLGPPMAGASRL